MTNLNTCEKSHCSKGIAFAIFAGIMAALASVSAKLATSNETDMLSQSLILFIYNREHYDNQLLAENIQFVTLIIRVFSVCGIFLCNALMWTLFTKSLQVLSSIQATITNTACNFLVSAIVGNLLFGEILGIMWWVGSMFILAGLLFIHRGGKTDRTSSDATVKKQS